MSFWVTHEMSCSGQALDSRATLDFSWLSFHPGTARVPNWRCLAHVTFFCFFFSFFFFSWFLCLTLQKIKTALHFVISLYLIPDFFITIYFIWDDLFNLIFFSILSPPLFISFKFGLIFLIDFYYLRWFLNLYFFYNFIILKFNFLSIWSLLF